jgi:hypothetical protein
MSYVGNTPTQQAFTPAVDYFSGNGSTTAFTLSRPVAAVSQVEVVVNNVVQNPSTAYTVSGNTITFTGAPSSGTNNIYVRYTSPVTQVIQPGQGTVSNTQMTVGAALANIGVAGLTPTYLAQPLTLATAQASTSGTSIDFTSIPSWVKRITVMFNGVSLSSNSPYAIVQLGAGSVTTSGYLGTLTTLYSASSVATFATTTGFYFGNFAAAADTVNGHMVLTLQNSTNWVASGTFSNTNSLRGVFTAGNLSLGGTLDRIRITTTDGTTTFDAGSINIMYEG